MMSQPFFSIIIPTRDRHETLPYALLTCLKQIEFEDYEIIISDNSDNRDLSFRSVERYLSEKVRYIYPPTIMPMTKHWEFALQYASGRYVTFLGDDDGLSRDCLCKCAFLLSKHNALSIISNTVLYLWPGAMREPIDGYLNNACYINKAKQYDSIEAALFQKNGHKSAEQYLNFSLAYNMLPSIYHGFVAMDVIKRINRDYAFFDSNSPDIYAALMVALHVENYLYLDLPVRIQGASAKSNGMAHSFDNNPAVRADFSKMLIQNPKLAPSEISVAATGNMDSILAVAKKIPGLKINYSRYFIRLFQDLFALRKYVFKKNVRVGFKRLLSGAMENGLFWVLLRSFIVSFIVIIARKIKHLFIKNVNSRDNQELKGEDNGFVDVDELALFIFKTNIQFDKRVL